MLVMQTRYDDFLLERALVMVAESTVVYSDRLRKMLRGIRSPVSDGLLSMEGKDLEVAANYLDLSDNDKEVIEFTPDKKAEVIKTKTEEEGIRRMKEDGSMVSPALYSVMGIDTDTIDHFIPSQGDMCRIISTHVLEGPEVRPALQGSVWAVADFSGRRAVVRMSRLEVPDNEVWTKHRQPVRVGRVVRAMLKAAGREVSDVEVEHFVNKYKAAWDRARDAFRNFEVVQGPVIAEWYSSDRYAKHDGGTLKSSCMRTKPTFFFHIYTMNPEVCSMLILKSESDLYKIEGRALVWETSEGITFMDRVYFNHESDVQLFRDYALSKGWYYKRANDSDHDMTAIGPDGQTEHFFKVMIKPLDYGRYPYMDTLKFLSEGSQSHLLTNDEYSGWRKKLESTTGGWEGTCETCNDSGTVECGECAGEGRVKCPQCGGDEDQECWRCDGDGENDCDSCDGTGKDKDGDDCEECSGKGKQQCGHCEGEGRTDCDECNANGYVLCPECDGSREVDCPDCS